MVYVLSKSGEPLMPTERRGRVRHLLKTGQAKVVRKTPFTIQLLYDTTEYVQPVTLGVDAGSQHIGVSATTEDKVLFEADVEPRNDIVENLSTRREARRARRNRKRRYRAPRFNNRVHSKHKGWLAPSVEAKIQTHLYIIAMVCKILPIAKIIVEVAAFDTQRLKAMEKGEPLPQGMDYQHGEQLDSWNVREYVLKRDNHTCRCCGGASGDKVLQVHHLESRKTGGDRPSNLVTLCKTCHAGYHAGTVQLPDNITKGNSYRDAAFMGIMRWTVYNRLKAQDSYRDKVQLTYGYITKHVRIQNGLPKDHYMDARCISGHPTAKGDEAVYYLRKIRRHNRMIHKFKILKDRRLTKKQAPYIVKGFRLFDKVRYCGKVCFISGRRQSGYFALQTFDSKKVKDSVSYRMLKLLEKPSGYIIERRSAPPTT